MYFYYRPRIDLDDVHRYSEGLIGLTACLNGLTARRFFVDGILGMWDEFALLQNIFWDDLYLEIQPTSKDAQRIYNEACREMAERHDDIKLVVTGDPHYMKKEDREFHEHLMRIKVIGSKEGEWKYPFVGDYHVRTYDEMVEQFAELHGYDVTAVPIFKAALDRPQEIMDSVERFDIKEGVKIPTSFV